ncbi:hypothetical protein [Niabella aquatica]
MDKASKIFLLIILFVFIGLMLYVSHNKSKLNEEGVFVSVRIVDYNFGLKSVNTLTCEFAYNHRQYRISTGSTVPTHKWKRLIGATFPAIYSPRSGLLEVLILPDDFEKHNLPYPDTLARWANEYLLNN